jgi:hypothetical protein
MCVACVKNEELSMRTLLIINEQASIVVMRRCEGRNTAAASASRLKPAAYIAAAAGR